MVTTYTHCEVDSRDQRRGQKMKKKIVEININNDEEEATLYKKN
jgi:hypothetical protein